MTDTARVAPNRKNTLVIARKVVVRWQRPDQREVDWYRIDGFDERVFPLQYKPDARVHLNIDLEGFGTRDQTIESIEVEVKDRLSGNSIYISFQPDSFTAGHEAFCNQLKVGGTAHHSLHIDLHHLLLGLKAGVNQNVVEAIVRVVRAGKKYEGKSTRLLHVLRQKLVLFVPGVMGSRITVNGHPNEEAYPEWSLLGEKEFAWLACDQSGNPTEDSTALRVDLFRDFDVSDVYDVEEQPAMVEPPDHPVLYKGENVSGPPVRYYHVEPWAYDWRLRLELAVNSLLGRKPGTPGAERPSLATIWQEASYKMEFLDAKFSIACHSTGGLITRGVLQHEESKRWVDEAFFVDVPFWGAPKAYYVYLTGAMGIAPVSDAIMRDLLPNVPILYYLAPTELYPDEVMVVDPGLETERRIRRVPGESVGLSMRRLVDAAREKGDYPTAAEIDDWNDGLENDANAFHASIQNQPVNGWEHCHVFWSKTKANKTVGPTFVNPGREIGSNVDYVKIEGDGTVPLVSQKADVPTDSLVEIPSHPEHVPSPNEAFVWETVLAKLRAQVP